MKMCPFAVRTQHVTNENSICSIYGETFTAGDGSNVVGTNSLDYFTVDQPGSHTADDAVIADDYRIHLLTINYICTVYAVHTIKT